MPRLRLAFVLALSLVASACGEDAPGQVAVPARPATLAELTGPWRPTPLLLDPLLRARVEDLCRRDMERRPGSRAAIMDARGASVVTVRMSGPGAGSCDALEVSRNGAVAGAGGGWTQDGVEILAPLDAMDLGDFEVQMVGGGELKVRGWSVYGRVGAAIASVVVETAGQPLILASIASGWFAAWWPDDIPEEGLGDLPEQPRFIARGYDAAGSLVAETGP
jgi:hypothetical protein